MDSYWNALAACGAQALYGAIALAAFTRRRDLGLHALGFAWPLVCWSLGALAVGASGALLAAFDLRLTPTAWAPPAVVVAFLLGAGARRVTSPDAAPARTAPRVGALWWIAAAAWTALVIDWIALANYLPVFQGDEASIWAAKAKVLFSLSGDPGELATLLSSDRLPDHRSHVHMAAYPWLVSLLQAHQYAWAGEVVHFTVRLPAQLFGALWPLALMEIARRSTAPTWWTLPLVGALVLAPIPLRGLDTGQAMSTVIAGVVLLVFARTLDRRWRGGVEALALLLLVATKPEGAAIMAAWAVATLAVRVVSRPATERVFARVFVLRSIAVGAPALVVFAVHQAANLAWGLEHHLADRADSTSGATHFVTAFVNVMTRHVFAFDATAALAGLALVAFVLAPARRRRSATPLFAAVLWLCVATTYYLVLATSPYPVEWQWVTAGPRIYAHVAPAAVVAAFALLAREPDEASEPVRSDGGA